MMFKKQFASDMEYREAYDDDDMMQLATVRQYMQSEDNAMGEEQKDEGEEEYDEEPNLYFQNQE